MPPFVVGAYDEDINLTINNVHKQLINGRVPFWVVKEQYCKNPNRTQCKSSRVIGNFCLYCVYFRPLDIPRLIEKHLEEYK